MKYVDLTHTLSSETPFWDGGCSFKLGIETDYADCTPPDLFRTQKIEMNAGIGTHMDAPAHKFEGQKTIDELDLNDLVTDCVVIDVSKEADENFVAMPGTIEKFEKEHGKIQPNTFVIFHTGWSDRWGDKEKYRNDLKFPSVHESTAKLLVERNIAGLGIDTLSADALGKVFPVHTAILGAGKYLVENIANANSLPATGAKIYVMPIKIKDGTEAPIRLIALV